MPYIVVYGTPPESTQEALEELMEEMVRAARIGSGIEYDENQVKVWFPGDRMEKGLGHEFSIDIACLDGKEKVRDEMESNSVAVLFCDVLEGSFPDFWDIECEVRPFKRHQAGHTSRSKVPPTEGGK